MIQVLRDSLLYGLNATNKVVSTRSTLPSLSCVLLSANGNGLQLSATNLQTAVQLNIGAKVDEPFSMCVPSKTLISVVSARTEELFDLIFDEPHVTLKIKSGYFKSNIAGLQAEEFPLLPAVEDFVKDADVIFELDTKELLSALDKVLISVDSGGNRPVLETVLFRVNKGYLTLLATDGVRMGVQTLNVTGRTGSWMIPATGLQQIRQLLLQFRPETIKLAFEESRVMFIDDKFSVMCQLHEGNYPDLSFYEKNAGEKFHAGLTVNVGTLKQTIKTAMVYYDGAFTPLRFNASDNKLNVTIESHELGLLEEILDVETSDEPFVIPFNAANLNDILRVIDSETVTLCTYEQGVSPVYIYAGDNNSFHYWVVMPLSEKR